MPHFVAYHSIPVVGSDLRSVRGGFAFDSKKPESLLRSAWGQTVWVIVGRREGKKTRFELAGNYRPDSITPTADGWLIAGPGTVLEPRLPLDAHPWFDDLKRRQSNFSFGFNRIDPRASAAAIDGLTALTRAKPRASAVKAASGAAPSTYEEGRVEQVTADRYERDGRAREACIGIYGTSCQICGISLSEVYGPVADGLIHVHHTRPLSSIGKSYRVNPSEDLIPICPNCHAIVHRRTPPHSVDEVRAMMREAHARGTKRRCQTTASGRPS